MIIKYFEIMMERMNVVFTPELLDLLIMYPIGTGKLKY